MPLLEKATFHHGTEDEVEAELGNQDRTQESASFECPCPMISGMNMSESTHRTGQSQEHLHAGSRNASTSEVSGQLPCERNLDLKS
mmetsp:Transcript_31836/g.40848  ORF Transcript_31836/g.40848 Transcript_31836/m.40848 type:complete len:86 (+) Transcript_31836:318-575(+)